MIFTSRFLVNIDTLFDLRLSTLALHDKQAFEKLDLRVYRNRISDVWAKTIGVDNWGEVYKKRTFDSLILSRPTAFLRVLAGRLRLLRLERLMSSPKDAPKLHINMYPYELNNDEANDFLQMFRQVFETNDVDLVYYSPAELEPKLIRNMWDQIYMYDWYEWVELNGKKMNNSMVYVTITRPAILWGDVTPEILKKIQTEEKNPFEVATKELREIVTVENVDAALFSLAIDCEEDFISAVAKI